MTSATSRIPHTGELHGPVPAFASATEIPFTTAPTTGIEKRLLSRSRTRYMADDLSGPLAHGSVESKALGYDSESMAMTDDQREAVFGTLTTGPGRVSARPTKTRAPAGSSNAATSRAPAPS